MAGGGGGTLSAVQTCDSFRSQSQKDDLSEYLRKTQERQFVYSRSSLSPTHSGTFLSRAGKVNTETNQGEIRELCNSIPSWMVSLQLGSQQCFI